MCGAQREREERPLRVGIFGGTFDPIHLGHLLIAEQVMDEMRLSEVIFVPSGIPPHKAASSVRASAEDRYRMVLAAVEGNPRFSVDRVEVEAGRAMHTVETVPLLKERHEGDEWFFITGADEVSNLLTWREPDRLLEQVVMVAATRPGYDLSKLDHLEKELRNFDRIFPVECSRLDISATNIRRRVLQGKSIRYMVPDGVYRFITRKKLYSGELHPETTGTERTRERESLNGIDGNPEGAQSVKRTQERRA
ncbi:TIGR00482: nicotinate (nicotinamide) nucleotide adenylyltransferase [Rubrobacter radiotolerans]|nr:TIGR00482: nicotinate (nicotinamide) nucleotide adenylyltransferase [Rubrobacter radiotolerans]SMC05493.1 nicotinate-nucleotide adenylyltransferase [Rubrobacter radiotolerans DSM 5868]